MAEPIEDADGSTRELTEIAAEALHAVGCAVPEPKLIRVGSVAIFQDREAGLIVRVGGDGTEMRRNLQIAVAMHQVGVPVLEPVSTKAFDIRGQCVTVWPLVTGGPRPSPVWLGSTARILHDKSALLSHALANAGITMNSFVQQELHKVRERITRADHAGIFDQRDLSAFSEKVEQLTLMLAAGQNDDRVIVHGDLYPGNTVATGEDTWLIDLDMVSCGPRAVDAAPEVVRERRFPGSEASYSQFVEGYGREPADTATVRLFTDLREITMVSWIAELAVRKPAVLDEARHRLLTISKGMDDASWTAA